MVKIAITTEQGFVAQHFGHCPEYTLVELEGDKVRAKEVIPNPGHQPGFLPGYLARLGVSCIIAGGMGQHAQELFADQNIQVIVGISGPVDQALADYLAGNLTSKKSLCDHDRRPGEQPCN